MVRKRKGDEGEEQARAKRTQLPTRMEEESSDTADEAQAPPPVSFTVDFYTADCFVDAPLMIAENTVVIRGTFRDERGREVLVHVPARSFFNLHTLDPNAPNIWDSLCLAEYFALPAWGPDLRRAWEALSTLNKELRCQVTDFTGGKTTIQLSRQLVRDALHLRFDDLAFNDKAQKDSDRVLCADEAEPRWDQLKCQAIRLALQIHMQHLHVSNPHRWSAPEKAVAVHYTSRQTTQPELKRDYVGTFLHKISLASQSAVTKGESEASRRTRPYLGAVMPLTRIVYHALGRRQLPEPWDMPEGSQISSAIIPGTKPKRPHKPTKPKKTQVPRGRPGTRNTPAEPVEEQTEATYPLTEEEREESMLLEALNLSKSEAGTSSSAKLTEEMQEEDEQMREAIRRSIYETHISQKQQSSRLVSTEEGLTYTETDMATVRQILISFNQDPEAVLGVHNALELLQEEKNKYLAEKEAQEEEERRKKRAEYERAMKEKGKLKMGEEEPASQTQSSPRPASPMPDPLTPAPQVIELYPDSLMSQPLKVKILSWNEKIKDEWGQWLTDEAEEKFKEDNLKDQQQQAEAAVEQNQELSDLLSSSADIELIEQITFQNLVQQNIKKYPE